MLEEETERSDLQRFSPDSPTVVMVPVNGPDTYRIPGCVESISGWTDARRLLNYAEQEAASSEETGTTDANVLAWSYVNAFNGPLRLDRWSFKTVAMETEDESQRITFKCIVM